jgi:hypothetical protein
MKGFGKSRFEVLPLQKQTEGLQACACRLRKGNSGSPEGEGKIIFFADEP